MNLLKQLFCLFLTISTNSTKIVMCGFPDAPLVLHLKNTFDLGDTTVLAGVRN